MIRLLSSGQRIHLNPAPSFWGALQLDLEDIQAKDLVKRFKKFWTQVARLPWWEDERWNLLKDIEELRNCIAHRNGALRDTDGRIRKLIQATAGVRLATNVLMDLEVIEINDRFCQDAIGKMTDLFKEIFDRSSCFGSPDMTLQP